MLWKSIWKTYTSMNSSVASGSVFFLNSTTSGSVSHAKVLNIDSSAPLKQG